MKPKSLPPYREINKVLNQTSLELHPSQVHGLICGAISGNIRNDAAWESLVAGGDDTAKTHDILQLLFTASAEQLDDYLFDFELVLPPDSEGLPARAEALTLWCQGFLTGLKLAQVKLEGRAPGEATEAIHDFVEIAKMNYEEVVASEEDEEAYTELVEYVRMAAILIYQDVREVVGQRDPSATLKRLH